MLLWQMLAAAANKKTYQQIILGTPGLVAYWPLNETTGAVAYDLSGNGNNGTYEGSIVLADYAGPAGAGGSCPAFNGTNAYVNGTQLLTAATASVTLEAWVNFEGNASPKGGCFLKNGGGTNGYASGNGSDSFDTAGNNFVGIYENVTWNLPSTTMPIPTSGWNHCVIVIGANSESSFYLNGVLGGTNSNASMNTPTAGWQIGYDDNSSSPDRYFIGALAQVALYTSALTAAEILSHYQAGTA